MSFIPNSLKDKLRNPWYNLLLVISLQFSKHSKLKYDKQLLCWTIKRRLGNTILEVPIRSFRELNRFNNFGKDQNDLVFIWINMINDCEVLYDIGSANGNEGILVNSLYGCKIVFLEIFIPSIENILKGTVLAQRMGANISQFEIFAAGCDKEDKISKVYSHQPPIPGSTLNSLDNVQDYCRGGRKHEKVWTSQWVPSITIDSLHTKYGIEKPTHIKIDIDGFEDRAIQGAIETIKSRHVRSFLIEVNGGRLSYIKNILNDNGYIDIEQHVHYPWLEDDAVDHLFVRNDLAEEYKIKLEKTKINLFKN